MTELPVDPSQPVADDDLEDDETELDQAHTSEAPEDTDIPDDQGNSGTDAEPTGQDDG